MSNEMVTLSTELGNVFVRIQGGASILVRVDENGQYLQYRGLEFKGYAQLQLVNGAWQFSRNEQNPERECQYAFRIERRTGSWQTVRPAPTHAEKIRQVILDAVRAYVKANPQAVVAGEMQHLQSQLDRVEGELAELDAKAKKLEIERLDIQQKMADLAKPVAKVLQLPVAAPAAPAPVKGQVTVEVTGHDLLNCKADIVPGKSIRIYGEYTNHVKGPQTFDRTFKVGDKAERDSYNLVYTGEITQIGLKTVTIKDDSLSTTSRLTLEGFVNRNWDFDLERIAKRNGEWMD